jgi:hypothetical protein
MKSTLKIWNCIPSSKNGRRTTEMKICDDNFYFDDQQEDEFVKIMKGNILSKEMSDIYDEIQMELIQEELEECDESFREAA